MNIDFLKDKKTYLSALFGLLIGLLSGIIFSHCNKTNPNSVIDQKHVTVETTRSETVLVDDLKKKLEESQKDNEKILEDMKRLQAELTSVQTVVIKTPGKIVTNVPSDTVVNESTPTPTQMDIDPFGYLTSTQGLFLFDKIGNQDVKIGQTSFSGFYAKPWSYTIYPKTYSLTTVIGTTEDGKQVAYNTFHIEVDGKKYNAPITSSIVYQDSQLKDKFFWWNPKASMSVSYGVDNHLAGGVGASALLSTMSYGEKKNPTWLFTSAGVGIRVDSQKQLTPNLVVAPVAFNLGKINKFTYNTYVGPEMHTNFSTYSAQIGIRVNF